MAEGSSSFTLPSFDENAEGWGPTQPPPQFADLPYAPFERKPFIGRMADWSAKAEMYRERNQHRRRPCFVEGALSCDVSDENRAHRCGYRHHLASPAPAGAPAYLVDTRAPGHRTNPGEEAGPRRWIEAAEPSPPA